jgi:hypothetical protein
MASIATRLPPATSAGLAIGAATVKNTLNPPAPNNLAASSAPAACRENTAKQLRKT